MYLYPEGESGAFRAHSFVSFSAVRRKNVSCPLCCVLSTCSPDKQLLFPSEARGERGCAQPSRGCVGPICPLGVVLIIVYALPCRLEYAKETRKRQRYRRA